MIAQVDGLSGGTGWLGTGLLGMILSWLLLKHLPDLLTKHDKQLDKKDEQISNLVSKIDGMVRAFSEELLQERIQRDQMSTSFQAELVNFRKQLDQQNERWSSVVQHISDRKEGDP